ncbi:MAG: hypothetical protein KGD65_01735 [Candidatus Lokiarchaeota archaeon]|nr:hypothetical protein [Candidatus Lokiarchaeota archaeon]
MKKRIIIFILFVTFIELFSISNSVMGFECNLTILEVDKEFYYPNEIVKINASWQLDYNPINEEAYIQVKLTDEFDTILWNSSKYDGIGNYTENWSIYINQLNLTLNNYTQNLYLKFLSVYHQIGTMDIISNLLETIQIKIVKRISSCELIGFKDQITYGESLSFQARFFDNLIENNTFLNNQLIIFRICSNNTIIFQSNFTTNNLGIIDILISSIDHLDLGVNNLVLKLCNNNVFNDSIFQYEVFVEKNPVLIDIINFQEDLEPWEDLIIELFYYYFFNNTLCPLKNQYIELVILSEKNITYTQIYNTDKNGILSVTIPHDLLSVNKENKELKLDLIFNGTLYLENKTLSLTLNININAPENGFQLNLVPFITVPAIIVLISLIILVRFKNPRKKILPDITIRY